ncbi:hypothetical protein PPERSA_10858 [Pseudocohnilembus persalinus]|uniref:Uncharacterized protein n=1 Tax=Pseudocohnilembus persalinus TaxID=266149 RepID=A0A0V0QDS9_PSEPJ|nr:hypothetical protein PPERSA_10858 [Pseudocohnilembus persalinus]|eukprot:KRX00359.1 hypothetical protein PPERSA_10858 [Pseudocohnilembus persalinus]
MSPKQKTTYNETKTNSQKLQKQQKEEQKTFTPKKTPQKHEENPENPEKSEKEAFQLEKMNLQIDKACFHIDKAVKIINETFLLGEQLLKNSQRQKTNQNLQITMSQCKICFEFLVNSISILNDLIYNSMNQFLQNCSSGISQNQLENYFDSVSSDKFKEKATPPSDPYQNPIEQQISVQPFQTDLQSQKQNIPNKENEVEKPVAQVFSTINIVQDGKKGKTVEKNFQYTFNNLIDQQTQVKINLTVVNDEVISQKKGNEYQKYPTYFKVDKISEYFLLNKSYQEFTKNEEFCDKTLNRWVIKGVQKNKGAGRKPLEWEKEQLSKICQTGYNRPISVSQKGFQRVV